MYINNGKNNLKAILNKYFSNYLKKKSSLFRICCRNQHFKR